MLGLGGPLARCVGVPEARPVIRTADISAEKVIQD
jgi:hypothetical protein